MAQVCDAIANSGLDPVVHGGGIESKESRRFEADRFGSLVAAYVRSGYPVLVDALHGRDHHTICIVGFRPSVAAASAPGVRIEDSEIEAVYAHDDNIGPSVRFKIERVNVDGLEAVELRATRPASRPSAAPDDALDEYGRLVPYALVAAVHRDIRVSFDALHSYAQGISRLFVATLDAAFETTSSTMLSLRIAKIADYLARDLASAISDSNVLAMTRLELVEEVDAMSLHVGIARIGTSESTYFDLLIDTTTSDHAIELFAVVAYHQVVADIIADMIADGDFAPMSAPIVRAYS